MSVGSLGMLSELPYCIWLSTREPPEITVLMLGCQTVNPGLVSEYPIMESDLGNRGRSMPDFMEIARAAKLIIPPPRQDARTSFVAYLRAARD